MEHQPEKYEHIVKLISKEFDRLYTNSVVSYDDLYQEGYIALLNGLKNYDPNKGNIEGYLSICIYNALSRYFGVNSSPLKISKKVSHLSSQINKMENMSVDDICSNLNISRQKYFNVSGVHKKTDLSMDIPTKESFSSLEEDEVYQIFSDTENQIISEIMEKKTAKEIAAKFNLSEKHVYQIQNDIKKKIHQHFNQ